MNREVLVPCVEAGCGTRTAVIRDCDGRRVRVEGVENLKLVGRSLHLELPVVEEAHDLARVELPGGALVWVCPARFLDTAA